MLNLSILLENTARRLPDKTALKLDDFTMPYARLTPPPARSRTG